MPKRNLNTGSRGTGTTTITLYKYIIDAVRAHCLKEGNLSVSEFIHKTLAERLSLPFARAASSRPYYPREGPSGDTDSARVRNTLFGKGKL